MDYKKFLGKSAHCECGAVHSVPTREVMVQRGALARVGELVNRYALPKDIMVVADTNTYEAAGRQVMESLEKAGCKVRTHVFDTKKLHHPDEFAIGSVMMAMEPEPGMLVAVGSGTLNDLCRFCANRAKIPYFVVGTAASMDGYASSVTPVTKNGMKITYLGIHPEMVICDLDVLAKAPLNLSAAGFGDIIGKVTARLDWVMAHLLLGERMCPVVDGVTTQAVEKCLQAAKGLSGRSLDALEGVVEALVLSGIAMQMQGDSRPASGAEHHLSHFLEMRDGDFNRPGAYHGAKVGMTTLIIMRLYEKLFEGALPEPARTKSEEDFRNGALAAFGTVGATVMAGFGQIYADETEIGRQKGILLENRELFRQLTAGLPALRAEAADIIASCGGPVKPQDLGYTRSDLRDAILYARAIRNKHTILTLLDNWGLLEKFAEEVLDEIF